MINSNISALIGFEYEQLEEDGSLGLIDTPFLFEDGDPVPVYVEEVDGRIRFFDDGGAIWHLMSLGVPVDNEGDTDFIRAVIKPTGAVLNQMGEIEAWAEAGQEPAAFARFLSAMLAMVRWEQDRDAIADERRRQDLAAGAASTAALSA